jgi:hypothetical protein
MPVEPRRRIPAPLLEHLKKDHPIEALIAERLIEDGEWELSPEQA